MDSAKELAFLVEHREAQKAKNRTTETGGVKPPLWEWARGVAGQKKGGLVK